MTGYQESMDILTDHAYPLTTKDSTPDILEVVQSYVSDNYSGDVGVIMMRDANGRQFLKVTSRHPDSFLIDSSVLHLNITVGDGNTLLCQMLGHNRQLYRETEVDRGRILEVGLLIEDLSKDRYRWCQGLPLDLSQHFERLNITDLCHLLVEKYDNNILYRSKSCGFLVERQEEVGGTTAVYTCHQCLSLASSVMDTLDIKPDSSDVKPMETPSNIPSDIIQDDILLNNIEEKLLEENNLGVKPRVSVSQISTSTKITLEGVQYLCSQCDYKTFKKRNLKPHIQRMHEDIKFACSHCEYQANTRNNLQRHIETKHEQTKYQCDQCDHQTSRKDNLKLHIQSVHQGIKSSNNSNYYKPTATECQECKAVFSSKGSMMEHYRTKHEGIRYFCDLCNFKATTRAYLQIHVKNKHEGIRYPCHLCEYQATTQCGLKKHIQSKHEGIKYSCDQCDYKAPQRTHLQRHIESMHKGTKYLCHQCGYQATQPSNLAAHIAAKHTDTVYMCDRCDYQTKWRRNFTNHKKTHELLKD